jgi:hypothetical protein
LRTYPYPVATLPGFEMLPDGGSRLFVEITRTVAVEEKRTPRVLTYVLKGAHVVLRNNENALVTLNFNTPVTRARLSPSRGDLLFSVDLRADASPSWQVVTDSDGTATLQIDFAKGSFLPARDVDEPTFAELRPASVFPPPLSIPPPAQQPTPSHGRGGGGGGSRHGIVVTGAPDPSTTPPTSN